MTYNYKCPRCGTKQVLRQRVTQRRRNCPHCGREIRPVDIDAQGTQELIANGSGCFVLVLLVVGGIVAAQMGANWLVGVLASFPVAMGIGVAINTIGKRYTTPPDPG